MYNQFIINNKKHILISLLIGVIVSLSFTIYDYIKLSKQFEKNISNKVIRFHVLANSDETFDQSIKVQLKDAILNKYKNQLSKSNSKQETVSFLNSKLEEIEQFSINFIKQKGYNYNVVASIQKVYFPTKVYGDVTFPNGMYEALKIDIGSGKGANWWCVMYPPLCYVDVTYNKLDTFTEEEKGIVLKESEYKFKFKIIELLNKK